MVFGIFLVESLHGGQKQLFVMTQRSRVVEILQVVCEVVNCQNLFLIEVLYDYFVI